LWTPGDVSLSASNSVISALEKALLSLSSVQQCDINAINNVTAALPLAFGILPTDEHQTSSPSREFGRLFVMHELIYNKKLPSLMTPQTRSKLLDTKN
jgi:hypothetical protein